LLSEEIGAENEKESAWNVLMEHIVFENFSITFTKFQLSRNFPVREYLLFLSESGKLNGRW